MPAEDSYLASRLSTLGIESSALDWTALDAAMDQLYEQGLSPGFELMGNPEQLMTVPTAFHLLRGTRASVSVARPGHGNSIHFCARFGADVVQRWRLRVGMSLRGSATESDGGYCCDADSFLAYWDACAMGLRAAEASAGLAPEHSCLAVQLATAQRNFARISFTLLERYQFY